MTRSTNGLRTAPAVILTRDAKDGSGPEYRAYPWGWSADGGGCGPWVESRDRADRIMRAALLDITRR